MGRAGHLSLELRRIGDTTVVSALGDIDLSTVGQAADAMNAAREAPGSVFLDLREVGFMDTSGLRLVIEEQRRAEEYGYRFAVFPGPPKVQRLFEIAGLAGDERLFADPSWLLAGGEGG
ncbi:MAG TPA: STAS domain-containing protein [Solirubrobacteraceae bacterium]|nr:STAS domain-containing protein [Solirubrobacteraceae bacterium]